MDYPKLNRRWVYSLTLEVFFRNFFTFLLIAAANTVLGYVQTISGRFGLLLIPIYIYFVLVTMIIAHKTVVSRKAVPMNDAFEISPMFRTYFWQYLGISLVPIIITVVGVFAIISNYPPAFGLENSIYLLTGTSFGAYYLILAMFGTSLTATAVGGDGMMMISRGRLTFFYSLGRQILLPLALIAAVVGAIWLYLDQVGQEEAEAVFSAMVSTVLSSKLYSMLLILGGQMFYIFLTLISGVVLTKAFILAELKMALQGEVSRWAAKEFGLDTEKQVVQYV